MLILGTLPGEESLRRREYYAHPRNLFWPIVFALFGEPVASAYADRLAFATCKGLALWDVCAAGARTASADATIRAEQPNAVDELLDAYPAIRIVVFNGSTARRLHDRHFARRDEITYLYFPSTSPAHARLGFEEKLTAWRRLLSEMRQHASDK